MLLGYARFSTVDQDLAMQLRALQEAGCKRIFEDTAGKGGAATSCPGLAKAIAALRPGDVLVVSGLSNLAQSTRDFVLLMNRIAKCKADFRCLAHGIDTSKADQSFFQVMDWLAALEQELIAERTRAGLLAAKLHGRVGGRKPSFTPTKKAVAKKLLSEGWPVKDVAEKIGISLPTLYRHLPAAERVASE